MWKLYRSTISKYPRLPLSEERRLIALAQRGSKNSAEEIVLRHIGFLIFRLCKIVFPNFLKRFGEDLLSEAILILYQKVKTYNLDYRDVHGNPKPVRFASYVWKRIDGFIIDSLKKEIRRERGVKPEILDAVAEISSWCRPFCLYTSYSKAGLNGGRTSFRHGFHCMTLRHRLPDFPCSLDYPV